MVNGLIGYKVGMTQVFSDGGKLTPVTVIEVGPCKVVQIKTKEKEGYASAQLSFDEVKESRVNSPIRGHFKKANVSPSRVLREFEGDLGGLTVGQVITAEDLEALSALGLLEPEASWREPIRSDSHPVHGAPTVIVTGMASHNIMELARGLAKARGLRWRCIEKATEGQFAAALQEMFPELDQSK